MSPPASYRRILLCNLLGKPVPALERVAAELQADFLTLPPQGLLAALQQGTVGGTVVVFLGGSSQSDQSGTLEAFRTIRLIRTRKGLASIPVVFVSHRGDYRLKLQCLSAGVTEYLTTPLLGRELRQVMAEQLGRAAQARPSDNAGDQREDQLEEARRKQESLENEIQSVRADLERQNEAREAIFELSRQELLEMNRRLKERYEAEILALKEKSRIEAMFGRYVSPEIVNRVLDVDKSRELDGVRRELTVFFADIRGFTSFCESQKAEKVIFVLNEFFTEATDIIHEHGGWVDKYTGDNIMALFGAPLEIDEHARAAVQAARLVQERFRTLRKEWHSIFGIDLGLGIGLATGDVVVGNLGSFQKISYTAIGDTVNVAARLEGICAHGRVLLDEHCYHRLGEEWAAQHEVRAGEAIPVKGKAAPVTVYAIDCSAGEPPLVGSGIVDRRAQVPSAPNA